MKLISVQILLLLISSIGISQVKIDALDSGILFTEKAEKILFYRTSGKEEQGTYQRTHYVHPLYSLDGVVLTEDHPPDHLHHHGIFWAWHQLYIGDQRIGDGWVNQDLSWKIIDVDTEVQGEAGKQIKVRVDWLSPLWVDRNDREIPVVKETTSITVYPEETGYRKIDFRISLLATEPDTRIGGSEDSKGYGGFSPRIRLPEDIVFMGPAGPVAPETNPVEAKGWLDMYGSMGKGGSKAGLAILSHPDNPGYPNPWILRNKGSMQNAVYPYPGATPVSLSNRQPTVLRYRLIIHGDEIPDLAELHGDYKNDL